MSKQCNNMQYTCIVWALFCCLICYLNIWYYPSTRSYPSNSILFFLSINRNTNFISVLTFDSYFHVKLPQKFCLSGVKSATLQWNQRQFSTNRDKRHIYVARSCETFLLGQKQVLSKVNFVLICLSEKCCFSVRKRVGDSWLVKKHLLWWLWGERTDHNICLSSLLLEWID